MNAPHSATLWFAADHPMFAGHFPGAPLVPGALLLDEVALRIAGSAPGPLAFARVKFRRAVLPEATVTIEWSERADGSHPFAVRDATGAVAVDGILTPHA